MRTGCLQGALELSAKACSVRVQGGDQVEEVEGGGDGSGAPAGEGGVEEGGQLLLLSCVCPLRAGRARAGWQAGGPSLTY